MIQVKKKNPRIEKNPKIEISQKIGINQKTKIKIKKKIMTKKNQAKVKINLKKIHLINQPKKFFQRSKVVLKEQNLIVY